MNKAQLICTAVFCIFFFIGFGPISPGCLIGMFVVLFRPEWFFNLAAGLYADKPILIANIVTEAESKLARRKAFAGLLTLFILDIAPVPVTPVVAFFIIFTRPEWFYRLIAAIFAKPLALAVNSTG